MWLTALVQPHLPTHPEVTQLGNPDANRHECFFRPLVSTLQPFAQQNGMTLRYDPGQGPWGDPQYQVSWINCNGQMCSLYITLMRTKGNEFHVHVLCWGNRGLAGRRDWDLMQADPKILRTILEEAKTWADSITVG
jgi:hypothetical protein